MAIERWILFGWCLTALFYICWYAQYDYIFGKSDVDNYLLMPRQNLSGLSLRHIIIQTLLKFLPWQAMIIILPTVFWYGIVWPLNKLQGINGAYNFIFATAAVPLFFIIALWSQFISIAFMLWAILFIKQKRFRAVFLLSLFSVFYMPMAYFYLIVLLPFNSAIIMALTVMAIFPQWFWWTNNGWNPAWVLLYYICPVLWIKCLRDWKDIKIGKFMLLTLSRLSRGLIFLFPFLGNYRLKQWERNVVFAWWSLIMLLAVIGLVNEASCVGLAGCERLHDYRWLYPSWAK